MLAGFMESPIGIEVATGAEGAKLEDGLRAVEAPACTRDVHAILDKVATGTFDDACGDWIPTFERPIVAKVLCVFQEVVGAVVDGDAVFRSEAALGRYDACRRPPNSTCRAECRVRAPVAMLRWPAGPLRATPGLPSTSIRARE